MRGMIIKITEGMMVAYYRGLTSYSQQRGQKIQAVPHIWASDALKLARAIMYLNQTDQKDGCAAVAWPKQPTSG